MKVFELMALLSDMAGGAEVRFRRLATNDELPVCADDEDLTEIDFSIKEAEQQKECGKPVVLLDGWKE